MHECLSSCAWCAVTFGFTYPQTRWLVRKLTHICIPVHHWLCWHQAKWVDNTFRLFVPGPAVCFLSVDIDVGVISSSHTLLDENISTCNLLVHAIEKSNVCFIRFGSSVSLLCQQRHWVPHAFSETSSYPTAFYLRVQYCISDDLERLVSSLVKLSSAKSGVPVFL